MIPAKKKDKTFIVDLLCSCFDDNNSVNYTIKQDRRRKKRIRILMEYIFETCRNFGEIYLHEERKGVVLILLPHTGKTGLKSVFRDLKVALLGIGLTNLINVLNRERILKKYYSGQYIYLWLIGVEAGCRGKGIGSSLLQSVIELGKTRNLPVYLETSTEKNLDFYNKHAFELYNIIQLSYTVYMYRKLSF